MSKVQATLNPLHHLWQVLDSGDLWQEGAAAEQTQLALAAVEQRVQRAAACLDVGDSNYLGFLRRSSRSVMAPALARAG